MLATKFICALVLTVSVLRGEAATAKPKCSESAKNLDDCLLKVEKTDDYKRLKANEKDALKACVKSNPSKTCQLSSAAAEICRDNARVNATLKALLKTSYTAIDNCFDGTVDSPYAVLRMTGDMGVISKNKDSGANGNKNVQPTTTPAPIITVNTDVSDISDTSGGSAAPANNCPVVNSDASSLLGGSSTDVSGNSQISDPTSLSGGLGGTDALGNLLGGGGLSSLGGLAGSGGLGSLAGLGTQASTALSGLNFGSLLGGRRKREVDKDCQATYTCISKTKQKSNDNDRQRAIKVYDQIQKCKANNTPPLPCLPSTQKQKKCVAAARKPYQDQLKSFMTVCLNVQTEKTQSGV